ncbi:hypothetical protein [Nitrosopumilus sp.]|uniref:hypothetical protein n=1 Tax=Nitrosopumilus sp. TaxID=2024843 RepID=UPI0034A05B6E
MSNIRVTYSGLFFFIIGIITIFTGLAFMLIITRSLTSQEYGTWNLINGLIMYAAIIQPVTSYWVTREIARGEKSGKTAVFSNGLFSSVGILIYLLVAFFTSNQTDVNQQILFFGVLLVPILFLNGVLGSINMGFKPHATSIGQFFLEISKIPLALFFVYFLDFGVSGIILAVFLGHIPSILLLSYSAREKIVGTIKKELFKKWIKLSWISLYPGIGSLLRSLDILIFSVITGSVIGLAYYGAAWSVSTLAVHSGSISAAVYSKLLGGGKADYLEDNITQIFYFAIPLSAISITFARPGLFALNPIYEIAAPLVLIMTMRVILDTFNKTFEQFITGVEKVDINSKSTFKNYVKSKLFVIPTIRLIQNGVYMVLLIGGLIFLSSNDFEFDLLIYWVLLGFFVSIPTTIYLYILVHRNFQIKIDFKRIIKYLFICLVTFVPVFLLAEQYLDYDERIIVFLPNLLVFIGLAIGGYLLLTCLLDLKTKQLFNSIITEIKTKLK